MNDDSINEEAGASHPPADSSAASPAKWQPLSSRQRRVLGVLIEKARTTPDTYPMTINAIVAGCNQKSNRDPQMNLSADDVEEVLEQLREMGVTTEVHGSGRVPKHRHHAYDWFGVSVAEIAVLAELMLRGEQTLGELRQRASRMETISSLDELKQIVRGLAHHKLIWELSPPGRGQTVTHGLYTAREQQQGGAPQPISTSHNARHDARHDAREPSARRAPPRSAETVADLPAAQTPPHPASPASPAAAPADEFVRLQLEELQQQVGEQQQTMDELQERVEQLEEQIRGLVQ